MRVWLKWTGIILLIPIALALSVSALFYIPPVQDAIIGKAAEYISKNIGMDIGFERIRLSFPLNLSARNVSVADAGHDTLLYLNKLTLQVRLKPLLQWNISVRGIRLEDLDFSTGKLLDGVVAGGHAGEVYLKADSIRPADAYALLNSVTLSDADVHLFVCDTTTADTSKSTTKWRIDLRKMELRNVAFSCRLPCDSVNLDLQIARAFLSAGTVDPETGRYEAEALLLDLPAMSYGTDLQEAAPGLDLSHINLSDVRLTFDSLYYESVKNMQARLTAGSARERSGLVFRSVNGNIASDSINLHIPAFAVQTDRSTLQLRAAIPWAAVDRANPGSGNHNDSRNNNYNHSSELSLSLSASIGKEDLILVAGNMPDDFAQYSPDASLRIELSADGNVGELQLHRFETYLPGAFRMNMTGSVHSVAQCRNVRHGLRRKNAVATVVERAFPRTGQHDRCRRSVGR